MENIPTPNIPFSDTENDTAVRSAARRQKAAELAGLMRLFLETHSDQPPTRLLGELIANRDTITNVAGEETAESVDVVDSLSQPENSTELANDGECDANLVNPADILRDRESIMAGVREQIRALADIHDPEQLVKGYEKPFRDALRVEVCAELERLIANGGEQLDLARTRYAKEFSRLFNDLGLRDTLGLPEITPPKSTDESRTELLDRYGAHLVIEVEATRRFAEEEVNPSFQNQLATFAIESRCLHQSPKDVKNVARTLEKVTSDYGGRLDKIKDAVRGRAVYGEHPYLGGTRLEDAVRDSSGFIIARDEDGKEMIKNGFISKDGLPVSIRSLRKYTDMKITVELGQEFGGFVLGEIVIAAPEMAAATNIEHSFYEIIRTLDADIRSKRSANNDISIEILLVQGLDQVSESFYSLATESLADRVESEFAESNH